MNFVKFPVNATNIFPIANTTKGGQYVTEFNLRALDSVATDERVQYMIGPSYVHSALDFEVKCQPSGVSFFEDQTTAGSSTVLTIMPGRGIINGHFVELLAPITIDMAEANAEAVIRGESLTGSLAVGLRAMYATERTIAGALLPKEAINPDTYPNPEDHPSAMYEGIQVVILPVDEFVLPTDKAAWLDKSQVTAHIKLATFGYVNNNIINLENNYPAKCVMLPASRIGTANPDGSTGSASSEFVRKTGLNPKLLYTFAGYGQIWDKDGNYTVADTWCDSTDSLMKWDDEPVLIEPTDEEYVYTTYPEATFKAIGDEVQLVLPHKQPDIHGKEFMVNQAGVPQRYKAKRYPLPVADFVNGTPGTVDKTYTNNVKQISQMIQQLYNLPAGKQRFFIEELNTREIGVEGGLPEVNPAWQPGDYILVGTDNTVNETTETVTTWIRNPSTIYVVLPGKVLSVVSRGVRYTAKSVYDHDKAVVEGAENIPKLVQDAALPTGVLLGTVGIDAGDERTNFAYSIDYDDGAGHLDASLPYGLASKWETQYSVTNTDVDPDSPTYGQTVIDEVGIPTIIVSDDSNLTDASKQCDVYFGLDDGTYRGIVGQDYFKLEFDVEVLRKHSESIIVEETGTDADGDDVATAAEAGEDTSTSDEDTATETEPQFIDSYITEQIHMEAFYVVDKSDVCEYTPEPIMLTGQIPLASTEQIGGFLNVDETLLDQGYVYLDSNGHLVLLDYALLRSGVLAYQLGQDFDCPAGYSYEEMQSWLNEYVNERVAFPNAAHLESSEHPHVIYINITLSKSEEEVALYIGDIDSRFGTSICLNIYGEADNNTTINISNCEKIRIGQISGTPKVNLYRCNLYYDANIISALYLIENFGLWYERYALNGEDVNMLPNLMVDSLTVTEVGSPHANGQSIGYWTEDTPNDNHFQYALKSVTFDTEGMVTGCGVVVKNTTTPNEEQGKMVISGTCDFPKGMSLQIPTNRCNKPIKITGDFVVAYSSVYDSIQKKLLMLDTSFTMQLPYYKEMDIKNGKPGVLQLGSIHFLCDTFYIGKTEGINPNTAQSLDGWDTHTYHLFQGFALS